MDYIRDLIRDIPDFPKEVAKVEDQNGTYTMIAHDGMHVGQGVDAGHGARK